MLIVETIRKFRLSILRVKILMTKKLVSGEHFLDFAGEMDLEIVPHTK